MLEFADANSTAAAQHAQTARLKRFGVRPGRAGQSFEIYYPGLI